MEIEIHSEEIYICRLIHQAIDLTNQLVWGNRMAEHIDKIVVMVDGRGVETDVPLLRGIADVYDKATRTATLHCRGLIDQGGTHEHNVAWAVSHDLCHAFDVAHSVLELSREREELVFMGRAYKLYQTANRHHEKMPTSHRSYYYEAHQYFEPWEVRPLMMADAVVSFIRQGDKCPNLKAS